MNTELRQLTSLDTQFLAIETDRNYGHTGALSVLDPSSAPGGRLTLETLKETLSERLHLVPPFTSRLAEVPFGLDWPYWVRDEHFDLGYHLREIALPAPGSLEQLTEQVGRIFSRRLDRSRPLWELYLIHGLEEGKIAMLSKTHHAAVDGMSGSEIMTALFDLTPEPRKVDPPPQPAPSGGVPKGLDLVAQGLTSLPRYPVNLATRLGRLLPHADLVTSAAGVPGSERISRVLSKARNLVNGNADGQVIERPVVKAPKGPYGGTVSPHRVFGVGSISLQEIKQVKNRYGVKVNDVVVSLVSGAVRDDLSRHGELPGEPLVVMVPISVRTEEELGTFGNKVSAMIVPLATHLDDPVERLMFNHEKLNLGKEQHDALPVDAMRDISTIVPPALHTRAARVATRISGSFTRPPWNVTVSNVPGPPVDLYCCGARLESMYPLSIISDGMGLNVTVISYRDSVDIGITADREQTPHVQDLVDGMSGELSKLLDRAP
ncbi:MAG: wax ester/triacylglycerol synthase family O-acyltransferase [Solirubrobacterales bacterium]|nr:wax ester/triacylglycerol synthase family O-acyltransferase [Solirubrobacterales bacterium]